MSHSARWWVPFYVVSAIGAAACGDDEGKAPGDAGPMPGDASNAGSGGVPSASGGTGGPPVSPPTQAPAFMCGDTTCVVPGSELAAFGIPAGFTPCCTEDDNQCGLIVTGDPDAGTDSGCVPRPPSDPVCPDVNLFGMLQPGCCLPNNTCGVNGAQVGMGCFATILGRIFGTAAPCGNDTDGGSESDAGP